MIEFLGEVVAWFGDSANWVGTSGILNRLREHLQITVAATAVSMIVAIPPAVWLAHRRIGGTFVVAVVNIARAIPSFAIVVLFLPISIRLGLGIGFWPTFLALLFLAIPPMFTNAYTGVAGVDPDLVEASRGMGMTDREVLTKVEIPMASPVVNSCRRSRRRPSTWVSTRASAPWDAIPATKPRKRDPLASATSAAAIASATLP